MSVLKFALRVSCAAAALCLLLSPTRVAAQPRFPLATGISPGDVIINDFFNDWMKFDPTTNQLFSLPWEHPGNPLDKFVFDLDGSILQLQLTGSSPQGEFIRVHPITGVATRSGPALPPIEDFDIAANGDLILTDPGGSWSIDGDVWSGGTGRIYTYSRQNNQLSTLPKPEHFSPRSVGIGPAGEVYVSEVFRGVVQVAAPSGSLTNIAYPGDRLGVVLDVFANGDLAYLPTTLRNGLRRLNPTTGTDTPLVNGATPVAIQDGKIDDQGNLWLATSNDLYFVDGLTGAITQRATASFFSPQSIAIVPADWTPPPIPEPATCAMSAISLFALIAMRRRN